MQEEVAKNESKRKTAEMKDIKKQQKTAKKNKGVTLKKLGKVDIQENAQHQPNIKIKSLSPNLVKSQIRNSADVKIKMPSMIYKQGVLCLFQKHEIR